MAEPLELGIANAVYERLLRSVHLRVWTPSFGLPADAVSVITQRVQSRTPLMRTPAAAAGGDVTWHGPGQAVLYPIVHVRELGTGARRYVEGLEDTMVHTAAEYGLRAYVSVPALAPLLRACSGDHRDR